MKGNSNQKFIDEVVNFSLEKISENYDVDSLSREEFSELLNRYQDVYFGITTYEIKEKGKQAYWVNNDEFKKFILIQQLNYDNETESIFGLLENKGIKVKQLT